MIIQKISSQAAPAAQPTQAAVSDIAGTVKLSSPPADSGGSEASTPREISTESLQRAVSVINQVMRQSSNSLQFSIDTASDIPVVRLVDSKTGELIRQIPSEETLAISRSIDAVLEQQGSPCEPGLLCKQVA